MQRLAYTIKLDATVQWRNKFYYIGVGLSLLLAIGAGILANENREILNTLLPIFFLFAIGGTSLLYIIGLIIFEKEEGTLAAQIVSPLTTNEYILSKLVTLALIGLVETFIVVLLAYGIDGLGVLPLLVGVIFMSVMLTLAGIILVVRYSSITDAFIPLFVVAIVTQLPFFYFSGLMDTPLWLIIPTGAPAMLLWGAWNPLEAWQWAYGIVYSLVIIGGLYRWSLMAFHQHIIMKQGS